jgi:membrane-associated protease RseP (regulator of RpoE activity)
MTTTSHRISAIFPALMATLVLTAGAQEKPAPKTPPSSKPKAAAPKAAAPKDDGLLLSTHRRARLGISVSLRARESDSIGAYINGVTPGGPAARSGIRSGDIITRLDGRPMVDPDAKVKQGSSAPGIRLIELAAKLEPEDTVAVEFRRGGETRTVKVVASPEPDLTIRALVDPELEFAITPEMAEAMRRGMEEGTGNVEMMRTRLDRMGGPGGRVLITFGSPLADLELAPINPELGKYFGVSEGILVISVPADSKLNLKPGDVVLSVDGRVPSSPTHLLRILRSYEPGEQFKMDVMRMKKKESVTGRLVDNGDKDKDDGEE